MKKNIKQTTLILAFCVVFSAVNSTIDGQTESPNIPNSPNMIWTPRLNICVETGFDTTKWYTGIMDPNEHIQGHIQSSGDNPVERQLYLPSRVSLTGSSIRLNCMRESPWIPGSVTWWQAPNLPIADCNTNFRAFEYTSGAITTKNKYLYGYFEIKFKVPKGGGYWPCFWLHNAGGEIANGGGEIDIFEMDGNQSKQCKDFWSNLWHYNTSGYPTRIGIQDPNRVHNLIIDFSTGYHTLGCKWTPTTLSFYCDKVEYATFNNSQITIPDYPMYIIVDLAVDEYQCDSITKYWIKPPQDGSVFIQHIKVWQEEQITPINQIGIKSPKALYFVPSNEIAFGMKAPLAQNIPNPFTRHTTIECTIPETSSSAELVITDVLGKTIKKIPINERGQSCVNFSSEDLLPGL